MWPKRNKSAPQSSSRKTLSWEPGNKDTTTTTVPNQCKCQVSEWASACKDTLDSLFVCRPVNLWCVWEMGPTFNGHIFAVMNLILAAAAVQMVGGVGWRDSLSYAVAVVWREW